MTDPVARKGLLLKADPIAVAFRDEVKQSLEQCRIRPKLVGILATSSAPSRNYAEYTKKQCDDLGIEFVLIKLGAAISPDLGEGYGVEEAIIEANEDNSVHGIMVRLFFPERYGLTDSCFEVYFPIFGVQQVGI
jgi:methylenetetrahydrofolate dehydrogenase (NAD+)